MLYRTCYNGAMALQLEPLITQESVSIPDTFFRATVEQYHRMIEAGVFAEDNAVELLEGWIIHKMAKNRPHTIANHLVRRAFEQVMPSGYYVDAQEPLTTLDSEPEPDVMIVRGALVDYEHQPTAADVFLVVEVSDATLWHDQQWKRRLYARAGIPVYWIVNLPNRQIEVYSHPDSSAEIPSYHRQLTYTIEDTIPLEVDGATVATFTVRDLLSR